MFFVRGAPLRGTFFSNVCFKLLHVLVKSLAFPRAFWCVTFRHVVAAWISMASAHDFCVDLKTWSNCQSMKKHCAAAVLSVCETRTIHGESAVAASAVGLQPKRFRAQEKLQHVRSAWFSVSWAPFGNESVSKRQQWRKHRVDPKRSKQVLGDESHWGWDGPTRGCMRQSRSSGKRTWTEPGATGATGATGAGDLAWLTVLPACIWFWFYRHLLLCVTSPLGVCDYITSFACVPCEFGCAA